MSLLLPRFLSRRTEAAARHLFNLNKYNKRISRGLTANQSDIHDQTEPAHIKAIVDQISQLKFHEVTLLNQALKRDLKIPDVQRVVATGQAAAKDDASDEGTSAGVKTSFTVKLTKFDDTKKVALIKEIKKLVEGINLVEAKRFVEECPKVIRSNLTKDEAEALQKQLETAGGVVKLE